MTNKVAPLECHLSIQLTLTAAETGHLVLVSLHSGNCSESLDRIVSSFAPQIQHAVAAQLADCLRGVVVQRLVYNECVQMLIPECEILRPTTATRAHIRAREFHKIVTCLETGVNSGSWTLERYRTWINNHNDWYKPQTNATKAVDGTNLISLSTSPTTLSHCEQLNEEQPIEKTPNSKTKKRIEIESFTGEITGILKKKM